MSKKHPGTDEHPLRTGILATVIGSLIVAAILAFPLRMVSVAVWHGLVSVVGGAWHLLTSTVPVPVWVLIIVCAGVLFLLARRPRSVTPTVVHGPDPAPPVSGPTPDKLASLDAIETKILYHYARRDAAYLDMGELEMAAQVPRLRISAALDHLEELGLIRAIRNVVHGPQYGLTREARDLLIAKGVVRSG